MPSSHWISVWRKLSIITDELLKFELSGQVLADLTKQVLETGLEVEMDDHGLIGHLSARHPVKSLIFRHTGADYDYAWHNAPERQYIVILEGDLDVEVGDGTRRRFGPGDILLAEDLTGRGHISRAVDGQPRRSLFITID